jgi:hypothetical protein
MSKNDVFHHSFLDIICPDDTGCFGLLLTIIGLCDNNGLVTEQTFPAAQVSCLTSDLTDFQYQTFNDPLNKSCLVVVGGDSFFTIGETR